MSADLGLAALQISDTYPTQYSQDLPPQLSSGPRIRSLDSLTVCNFKSFQGQHYIGPFLPFTSVIGPNGSGKSNILEAILFCVCSQQSNGSGSPTDLRQLIHRKQSQTYHQISTTVCWVQLRFLLSDGSYRPIKRQLTVSGSTRYSINHHQYPFKVYTQYLNSTGLLTSTCNFAICQNQTDRLTNKQPNQLRHHFQLLSGSVLFKQQYEQCKNQLERLNKTIEEDTVKIARLKQERKNLKENRSTAEEYRRFESRHGEVMEMMLVGRMLGKEIEVRELGRVIEGQRSTEGRVQEEWNRRKVQMQKDMRESIAMKNTLAGLMEEVAKMTTKLKSLTNQQITLKTQQLKDLQAQHQLDQQKQSQLKSKLEHLKTSFPPVPQSSQLYEYLQLYSRWQKQNYLLKCDLQKKHLNLASFDRLIQSKQDSLGKIKQTRHKNEQQQANKNNKVKELQETLVEVKASLGKARRDIDRVAENVRVSEERRREKEEEMARVDGMIQELEGKMLEGVEEGKLKELCRKLMAIEGFKGMLGDRIKPIQAKYSTCFSLLMSSFDKYLLSTDQQSSKLLANKLKDLFQIKTVVILSNTESNRDQTRNTLRKQLLKLGLPALDIVDFDRQLPGLESFLSQLLKGKVVCQDLETAFRIRSMNVRGVKEIYTMDGSVLRDDGMISSMGNTERSRKVYRFDADGMKKIEREMGQLHRQRGQLEEEVKGLREQASATNVIKMVEQVAQLEKKQQQVESQIEYWRNYKLKKADNYDFLEMELEELRKKRARLEEQLHRAQKSAQNTDYFGEFMKKYQIDNLEAFRSSSSLSEVQNTFKQRNQLTSQIQDLNKQLLSITKKNLPSRIHHLTKQLSSSSAPTRQHLQSSILSKQHQISQLRTRLNSLSINLDPTRFKSQLPELEAKCKFLESQKATYLRELNEEFSLSIEQPDYGRVLKSLRVGFGEVTNQEVEEFLERLEVERRKVEAELEKYHSFSVVARADGAGLENVYNSIKALEEKVDSNLQSKQSLRQTLNTASQSRRKTLVTFLQALRPVLSTSYKLLTETSDPRIFGHADLFLQNQDLPFQHGIYFSPTPPSKRFVYDMQQLSGGEKSLASIALQFAIAVVTHAPMLVFDETDAFLDVGNVGGVLRLVRRGIEGYGLQFVVVSHKANIFEQSSSLVGVTNQSMTSQAFSLKLE